MPLPDTGLSAPTCASKLPLAGIRVVEFSHMVMGPTCGMILGDLGAEIIKVEPVGGDNTRFLPGPGSGFFRTFNRNKVSFAVDMDTPAGLEAVWRLVATADVVLENFRPGRMAKFGLDYATLSARNSRIIYASLKGFLAGPYQHRTALDEAVQMMGGLAYMTGPVGRPLRAGASVIDIMGGTFGALGVLAALRTRDATGRGQEVQSSLFESVAMLSGQHMQQFAITGEHPQPMPSRSPIFSIYDVFNVQSDAQIFLAVVSDGQWRKFCEAFKLDQLAKDTTLASNTGRCDARDWLLPQLQSVFLKYGPGEVAEIFERIGLPFAPISRPEDLFDDPHLNQGGLATLVTETGATTRIPLLPFAFNGKRLGPRMRIPPIGAQSASVLESLGYSRAQIDALVADQVIAIASDAAT